MRDMNIAKSFQREINLKTKVVRDRTKYTRKSKHKNKKVDLRLEKTNFRSIFSR